MRTWWKRYLHSGFDPEEDNVLAWRGRALAITSLATAGASGLLMLDLARVGLWPVASMLTVVATVCLLLPLLQRRPATLESSGHVALILGLLVITGAALYRGGLSSQVVVALGLVPTLAAYLFRDTTRVLLWAVIGLLTLVTLSAGPALLGIELVDQLPSTDRPLASLLTPGLVLALITVLSRTNARIEAEVIEAATVAERERMESEQANNLQRAEQMALVGQLAVGVAHEVNNPLAYIGANIDYTAKRLRNDDEERWTEELAALRDASDGVHRISEIVNQLNAHGRKDEEDVQSMRLRDSLELALRIARNQIRHRARVYRQYNDDPAVLADPGRLTQVFLNLLVNAAQAVPTGKRNDNEIRIELRTEGRTAVVEISDTGQGIAPEVLERVTEPFFTTKDVGRGTGLGLSISDAIVRSYSGTLQLTSEVGRGTRAQVRLPLTETDPITLHDDHQAEIPLPAPGREPRLLLIDDDATVRRGLARVLPGRVVEAGHVQEALDLIEQNPRFDVIICDVMMPDMTGIDFYKEVTKRYPELRSRLLFVTGGVFDESAQRFISDHGIPTLAKPVKRQALATLVDELMSK